MNKEIKEFLEEMDELTKEGVFGDEDYSAQIKLIKDAIQKLNKKT